MVEPLDPTLCNRLTRFLHTGNEIPKYYPGCWASHRYYEAYKLNAIDEIFVDGAHSLEVIDIIKRAAEDGWYTRFETIAFALAKCLLKGNSKVKEATYKAAADICQTTEQMLLFHKFTRQLRTGNGRGWCKNVFKWYSSKPPMELAREVSRVRGRYGRSHRTLLRKSHFKIQGDDYVRDVAIKYSIFGLRKAKAILGDKPETVPIFDYLQKVEEMRHCESTKAAAEIAAANQFTLDHVPGHLLTSQDVWNAVLPQFSLEEILYNLQRIHNMGFFGDQSSTTSIVINLLQDQERIRNSKLTPLAVYICLRNYTKKSKEQLYEIVVQCAKHIVSSLKSAYKLEWEKVRTKTKRPLKYEKAKIAAEKELRRRTRQVLDPNTGIWTWTTTRRHPKELKSWGIDQPPNQDVILALGHLMDNAWVLPNSIKSTNSRYLITIDMRNHMFKGRHFCKTYIVPKKGRKVAPNTTPSASGDATVVKISRKRLHAECFYNKNLTPGHAAIILALQILKKEPEGLVTLAVFTEAGIEVVKIDRASDMTAAEQAFKNAILGRVQLDAPMNWAGKMEQKFDVFINMVDRSTRYMELDKKDRGGRGPGGRYGPPPPETSGLVDHCPVRALERYREASGVRNAKLIVMNLAIHRAATTDGSHEGVLDIVGVDEHVPKVIDAFVRGQFK